MDTIPHWRVILSTTLGQLQRAMRLKPSPCTWHFMLVSFRLLPKQQMNFKVILLRTFSVVQVHGRLKFCNSRRHCNRFEV